MKYFAERLTCLYVCLYMCVPVAQWVEHCVSSAKVSGFDSQGTHVLIIQMYNPNWIKTSAKCIHVNI